MNTTITLDLKLVLIAGALWAANKQISTAQYNAHIEEMARIANDRYALETERMKVEGTSEEK